MFKRAISLSAWPLLSLATYATIVLSCVTFALHARAEVPAERLHTLSRGVNFTNWFRYPARQDDEFLRSYIPDSVLTQLHDAGFTFVRLAVQPELMLDQSGQPDGHRLGILAQAIARIQRHRLGVMVGWHPQTWHLEESTLEQQQLQSLWGALAPLLRGLDAELTFPEVLNEPIYPNALPAWETQQRAVLARIRLVLPDETVILTSNHWGAIDALVQLHPVGDSDVVYSFHTYEPATFTSLANWDPQLDLDALKRLPFPVHGDEDCVPAEHATAQQHTRDVIHFYCSQRWDAAKLRTSVDQAAAWGRAHGVPVIAGEFGASRNLMPQARLAWISDMRRAFEANGIGWALWGYDDSMGFDLHPLGNAPRRLDSDLLHALGLGTP